MNNSIVSYLKANAPLVDVVSRHIELKRKGGILMGRCPFHSDKSPSLSVDPAKSYWRCWACGFGGDQVAFVRRLHGCSFVDACKELIETYNIPPPENIRRKLLRQQIRQLEKTDLTAAKELARQL